MSHVRTFFEHPGLWFNLLSFAFTTLGVLLGIWALWIALVQLRKTLTAAQAARSAAEAARSDVSRIVTVVDLQRLSAVCLEIVTLLESGRGETVSRPLHQLRTGLVQLHATDRGLLLGAQVGSVELISEIEAIQQRFDTAMPRSPDARAIRQCMTLVKAVDAKLHQMVPAAAKI